MARIEDDMPGKPAVSVLLPTWNTLRFLPAAVESILAQEFADFELIVVDDGSTDGTADYLDALRDPRLRVLRMQSHVGVTAALNHGLAQCSGTYVARMDADDISEPNRFAEQVRFLDQNPDVGVLGSARLLIDENGAIVGAAGVMFDDLSIRWRCLLGNPLPHPTVMLRRDIFVRHDLRYDEAYSSSQDYELWTRLLPLTRAHNLEAPLLRYRLRESSISTSRAAEQIAKHHRIARLANQRMLPTFPLNADEIANLCGRYGGKNVRDPSMDPLEEKWLRLLEAMLCEFCRCHATASDISSFEAYQRAWIDRLRG
jgi:glycosyltransferase involved in cell wall biosynthesis